MVIGIDATTLCDKNGRGGGGIEHYTWSILFHLIRQASKHKFIIVVPKKFSTLELKHLVGESKNVKIIRPIIPRIPLLSRHVFLPIRLHSADILFSPYGQLPIGWNGKSVVTVHDASIFEHPEWFPEKNSNSAYANHIVEKSIEKADVIIAVSNFTKKQLARVFPVSENKTRVVYEGVEVPMQISSNKEFIEDIVLFVGTIEPRKNLINAIEAFDRFVSMYPEKASMSRFIMAGKMGWKTKEIEDKIFEVNQKWIGKIGDDIIRQLGYVSESKKWALLAQSSVFLFPSFEEGFGLPVLEAMAVGAPVITSNRGALSEIGGEGVFFADPDDIETMSLAMAQCFLLPEGVNNMRSIAMDISKSFTWEKAAQETLKVMEEIIS